MRDAGQRHAYGDSDGEEDVDDADPEGAVCLGGHVGDVREHGHEHDEPAARHGGEHRLGKLSDGAEEN